MKKEPKHIIGIDLDDTVLDFNNSLHTYHNAKYGTNVTRKDITTFGIEDIWGCTAEEASKKVFEFCSTTDHDNVPAVPGVREALAQAREIATKVKNVFLLDCPWNQGELPANVLRVNSWDEIVTHLNTN